MPAGGSEPDTRTRILMASFQLFHEQGFHATGIATILRETDPNPGSLYHFFPSKDALLIGVLEFALVLLRPAVMDPAEKRSDDPIERMFELLQQYPEGMHAWGCKMGCPIGNLALEVSDDNHAARALIHQNFENWTTAVKKWLDDADFRVGGLIRTVYDPKAQLGDPATIINEIMVFEPEHMLAMRIHKPSAGLPYPQAWQSMWVGDHVHRPR